MPSGKALPRSVKNLRPQHMTGLSGHTPKTKASAPACQGRSNTPRYHFACCVKTATLPRMVHWPCCPITWAGRHHATWGTKPGSHRLLAGENPLLLTAAFSPEKRLAERGWCRRSCPVPCICWM